MKVFHASM